jgi:AcrR family transcriptional regulator
MTRRRRTRRPAERPDELATAALKLFCRRGYYATSIDDVAREAGVTKGAVYHHFSSKEELLVTALEGYWQRTIGTARRQVERADPKDAVTRFRLVVDAVVDLWMEPAFASAFCLVFGEVGTIVPALRSTLFEEGPARGWRTLTGVIEQGQSSGAFRRDVDAYVMARMIGCSLSMQSFLLQRGGLSANQLRTELERTVALQLDLLRPPHASAAAKRTPRRPKRVK